jgi:hypothetical protein
MASYIASTSRQSDDESAVGSSNEEE